MSPLLAGLWQRVQARAQAAHCPHKQAAAWGHAGCPSLLSALKWGLKGRGAAALTVLNRGGPPLPPPL